MGLLCLCKVWRARFSFRFRVRFRGFGVRVPVAATKPVRCSAVVVESGKESGNVEEKSVSVILLAGGKGNRMGVAWGCLWCSEFCWIGSDVILNFAWQEDSRIVSGVNVAVIVLIRCCYRM
ncbi:hypothetical protein Droror1_Dr00016916 [Drosera rotundifolia]